MPLFNDDLFHSEWKNNEGFRDLLSRFTITERTGRHYWQAHDLPAVKADRESALEVQAALRNMLVVKQAQLHKQLRPWDVTTKALAHLDRREPWWGFEFETGWASQSARGAALAFTYDHLDGAMYDGEGEGNWQVEITFLPEEQSKYLNGTSTAHKFMQWMTNNPKLVYKGSGNNVGTHLNMSHPAIVSYEQATDLASFLNRTLHHTVKVNGQRKLMFGREQLYAGFFPQYAGGNAWVEFKGYRTAYTIGEFNQYLKSAAALQKCIDLYIENPQLCTQKCVTNLYDVSFNGADPELAKWNGPLPLPAGGVSLHFRGHMGMI